MTSRSVNVTWNVIECIERNGIITNYTVVFQEQDTDGATIPGEVMGQSFTATELTPYTSYTFQVAGVNSNGAGPFSDVTTILIDEDGLLISNYCCSLLLIFHFPHMQFLVLYLTSLPGPSSHR